MQIEHLYRQIIMDHYKSPRNKGLKDDKNYFTVNLVNPSCGDDVTVQVLIEDNIIKDIRHLGIGCSICCSSASVMSEELKGKTVEKALNVIAAFNDLLMNKPFAEELLKGDALAYQGVSKFPARIRCANLAWYAAKEAILKEKENSNG